MAESGEGRCSKLAGSLEQALDGVLHRLEDRRRAASSAPLHPARPSAPSGSVIAGSSGRKQGGHRNRGGYRRRGGGRKGRFTVRVARQCCVKATHCCPSLLPVAIASACHRCPRVIHFGLPLFSAEEKSVLPVAAGVVEWSSPSLR
jgi:hypothetical protein